MTQALWLGFIALLGLFMTVGVSLEISPQKA